MAGYRVLAFLLGVIFLALAVGLFLHEDPRLLPAREALLSVDNLKTTLPAAEVMIKKYIKFALSGGAFIALLFSLLFFVSVFTPMRMIPFIVVVIICCILAMVAAIWRGYAAKISWYYWGGEAIGCLVLAVLLAAFFPRAPVKEEKVEETVKQ
jgi:hypothetical protein